jgi:hypothetical protein
MGGISCWFHRNQKLLAAERRPHKVDGDITIPLLSAATAATTYLWPGIQISNHIRFEDIPVAVGNSDFYVV